MLVESVLNYLTGLGSAFSILLSGYIERYEEEFLTPEGVNIRIRVRFPKGHTLEWNEAVIGEEGHVEYLAYRYHFQDRDNKLIFRYDNPPHFPRLHNFPHHKHLPDNVIESKRPSVSEVLKEVNEFLEI